MSRFGTHVRVMSSRGFNLVCFFMFLHMSIIILVMSSLGSMANFELELVSVIIVELPQLKLSSSRFEGIVEIFALLHVFKVEVGCSMYMCLTL